MVLISFNELTLTAILAKHKYCFGRYGCFGCYISCSPSIKFPSYLAFISLLFLSNTFSQKFSQINLTWEAFSLQFMQHVTQ